jgi:hypothetical protein
MNPLGSTTTACPVWACELMHGLLKYVSGSLGGSLLFEEILVIGFGHDFQEAAHAVMA